VVGLAFAGFIMTQFMFPALIVGHNPVLVGLVGSSAIMFVVLYAGARVLRPYDDGADRHTFRAVPVGVPRLGGDEVDAPDGRGE